MYCNQGEDKWLWTPIYWSKLIMRVMNYTCYLSLFTNDSFFSIQVALCFLGLLRLDNVFKNDDIFIRLCEPDAIRYSYVTLESQITPANKGVSVFSDHSILLPSRNEFIGVLISFFVTVWLLLLFFWSLRRPPPVFPIVFSIQLKLKMSQ